MALVVFALVYFVIGCGAAASLLGSRPARGPLAGIVGIVLMLVFWPFLFPVAFLADTKNAHGDSSRSVRLRGLASALHDAWNDDDRARDVVERYIEGLSTSERRLRDLQAAIDEAPDRIKARLEKLRDRLRDQVDGGLDLLEELTAQLTLLRFAQSSDDAEEDRSGVEDLLERMAALAQL